MIDHELGRGGRNQPERRADRECREGHHQRPSMAPKHPVEFEIEPANRPVAGFLFRLSSSLPRVSPSAGFWARYVSKTATAASP